MEVCPTGVFTDATLKRHYTRKWDLQMAPSVRALRSRDATSPRPNGTEYWGVS